MQFVLPFPDISPVIFSFELGPLTLAPRWYAVAYILGLVLAWRWIVAMIRNPDLWKDKTPPLNSKQVEDLLTWVILGVIIGGRLGFVLFYDPGYYLAYPLDIPKVWQGGMSFHGGFIGVIVAGVIYARKHMLPIASVGDCFAVTVAIGLSLGRLSNFVNAELWGRPTTMPWSFVFPGMRANQCPVDWVGECSRHPSQLYEAGLEGLLLGVIMFWLAHRRGWLKTPGALVGLFFVIYGASRSFVELFRQPDAQFTSPDNPLGYVIRFGADLDAGGITMGQILSLPMIAIGLFILWRTRQGVGRGT